MSVYLQSQCLMSFFPKAMVMIKYMTVRTMLVRRIPERSLRLNSNIFQHHCFRVACLRVQFHLCLYEWEFHVLLLAWISWWMDGSQHYIPLHCRVSINVCMYIRYPFFYYWRSRTTRCGSVNTDFLRRGQLRSHFSVSVQFLVSPAIIPDRWSTNISEPPQWL